MMISQLSLNPDLFESVQEVAREQGQSVESVLDDLMRQYLREARNAKIDQECEHFERMHPELKKEYLGQHVAIHNGRLVDHDYDPDALARRIREKYGRIPVLVTFVEEESFPPLTILSPRLVTSE